MVAYSFQASFAPPILARTKRQTIRGARRRHAQPGERVQLYVGMRTAHCRKVIPDPVCIGIDEVRIDPHGAILGEAGLLLKDIAFELPILRVNGRVLAGSEANAYALGDGFSGLASQCLSPIGHMAIWWLRTHGPEVFEGFAIRWEDRP